MVVEVSPVSCGLVATRARRSVIGCSGPADLACWRQNVADRFLSVFLSAACCLVVYASSSVCLRVCVQPNTHPGRCCDPMRLITNNPRSFAWGGGGISRAKFSNFVCLEVIIIISDNHPRALFPSGLVCDQLTEGRRTCPRGQSGSQLSVEGQISQSWLSCKLSGIQNQTSCLF